jgi:hypothetical protein
VTVEEFARAIVTLRRRYNGWVTSWGRSDRHSVDAGGFAGDPHTWDLGVDMLYTVRPDLDTLRAEAEALGLKVLREVTKPHDHYQPADFPAGPVVSYNDRTREDT